MAQHTTIISGLQSITLKLQELTGYNPLLGDKIQVMEHLTQNVCILALQFYKSVELPGLPQY